MKTTSSPGTRRDEKMGKRMTVKAAMRTLATAMREDSEYAYAWQSNIAMAYLDAERWYKERHGITRMDARDKHVAANEAAQHFMRVAFGLTKRTP
jgi:hypothetical protein